jgi:hypothetical protein
MTSQEFVEMVAGLSTEEELDAEGCENVVDDCIESMNSLIEMARRMVKQPSP